MVPWLWLWLSPHAALLAWEKPHDGKRYRGICFVDYASDCERILLTRCYVSIGAARKEQAKTACLHKPSFFSLKKDTYLLWIMNTLLLRYNLIAWYGSSTRNLGTGWRSAGYFLCQHQGSLCIPRNHANKLYPSRGVEAVCMLSPLSPSSSSSSLPPWQRGLLALIYVGSRQHWLLDNLLKVST